MLGRKPANKRRDRAEVLEVRGRSRAARHARLRLAGSLVALVGGVTLALLVAWQLFVRALDHFVYRNPRFAIQRIDAETTGRLRSEQVRLWTGVRTGENLMALSPTRVQSGLKLVPWILEARVERRLPDQLVVRVDEREPVARAVVTLMEPGSGRLWQEQVLIDQGGTVLPPLDPAWLRPGQTADFSHLTRLDGLPADQLRAGTRLDLRRLRAALELLRTFEDSSMFSLADLESLDLSGGDAFRGVTRQGTEVLFGTADFRRQMLRWRAIHDEAAKLRRSLAWLDLSVANNVPARFAENPSPPAAHPVRPARPQRVRRSRHV